MAPKSLTQKKNHLLRIFHSLPDLYCIMTPDLIIVDASDSYLEATFKKREDIVNRNVFDVFPDAKNEHLAKKNLLASYQRVLETRSPDVLPVTKYSITNKYNEFEEHYWLPVNYPIFDENNNIIYILHHVEDVTQFINLKIKCDKELKTQEIVLNKAQAVEARLYRNIHQVEIINQKLKKKNAALNLKQKEIQNKNTELQKAIEAKDKFFASMSHELRTPLNAILGFVTLLLMKLPGSLNEEQEKQLNLVKGSAKYLLSYINDLLMLAEIQAGKMNLKFENVNLNTLINEINQTLQILAKSKDTDLSLELNVAEDAVIYTSKMALAQIINNVVNAILKYTARGFIKVIITLEYNMLRVEISSSHSTLSADEQKELCYFSTCAKIEEIPEESRLNLFLSKRLAKLINAKIECNVSEESGLNFTITQYQNLPKLVPQEI